MGAGLPIGRNWSTSFIWRIHRNEWDLLSKSLKIMDKGHIKQGPLKKWAEHSQELHLLKIHSRGDSYYTQGLDGGWFFGWWAFIILKSSYQDLSNKGSKIVLSSLELAFKLLKHGHFWINFRFWLVWVELRKSKALSSLNFLQTHEKYQIGSCPQLLYA